MEDEKEVWIEAELKEWVQHTLDSLGLTYDELMERGHCNRPRPHQCPTPRERMTYMAIKDMPHYSSEELAHRG